MFPDTPPPPETVETFSRPAVRRAGAFVGMLLTFLLGFALGFPSGTWVAEAPPVPPAVAQPADDPLPAAPPTSVVTQELLDQKVERMAFFTGRGQPEGAVQILRDTIVGSGCEIVEARWSPFDDMKTAVAAGIAFKEATPKSLLASTAVVRAERPDLAGGKYVGAGVSLRCPQPEEA